MLATDKTKLGLHINQKSSTDKCRTTFTYLVIFGKWMETSQQYWIWATGLSSWSKRLHNCHHVCPVSEPCVVQTVYQQLCQLIRRFCSSLFTVFWPQTDTSRTFHFPRTSCRSSGTTSRGAQSSELSREKISINLQASSRARCAGWPGWV